MKCFAALLLLSAVALASSAFVLGNGRPGCKTEQELNISIFRDNWDPTAYWKCQKLNEPAVLEHCPENRAFLDSAKDCVPWNEWQWELPLEPLSEPDEE